jgi:phage portal protein BeeE
MVNNNLFNFWQTFFGSDNFFSARYIDQFGSYISRVYGQKTAIWVDTKEAFRHYLEVPELRAVVNKRASMMAAGKPYLLNENTGEVVENHWSLDLISKPNATQSWQDVIFSLSVNDALYSNSFAYCPERSFGIRNHIQPLPSDRIIIETTGVSLRQMENTDLIKQYKFQKDDGEFETLEVQDVIYLMTPDGINIINPNSRLDALKFAISNIRASYAKRNVLLENIGAIGILSAKNTDMSGALPMSPEEKREIQQDWYRRSKDELIITEADVNWTPMSYPTKDLLLFEELNADKLAIIDVYGLNSNMFGLEKSSTYENVREGLKMAYTDTIIPETEQMYDSLSEQLGLQEDGLRLKVDFSHLAILQKDEKFAADTLKVRADALSTIVNTGVFPLSQEEIRSILGLD